MTNAALFIALFLAAGLAAGRPGAAVETTVTAEPGGIAAGGDIKNNTINQTIFRQDPAVLAATVKILTDQNAATSEARVSAEREAAALAEKLKLTTEAVTGFLQTLGEQNIPREKIPTKLIEIATQAVATRQRLALLDLDDPVSKALVDQAKVELDKGHPDAASALLQRAEEAELAAAAQARALAERAKAAENAHQLHAAMVRESLGDVALTQLHYREAAGHFGAAAARLPAGSSGEERRLLVRQANALFRQGDERGDKDALTGSVAIWKELSLKYPRELNALEWASAQNALGVALRTLGELESGTARLEESVAAYHAALTVRTHERVPLQWATTQMNLGNALETLGERESGTVLLKRAVAAYHAALMVRTREQAPLDWATTQMNLGNALMTLGERDRGMAHLKDAVAAYRAALTVQTREQVPLDWAGTQFNLGRALELLGRQESGTASLEQAIAADRAALEEATRERVPVRWAMTQVNLGCTLLELGKRESGTAHLEEAVAFLKLCLVGTDCPQDLAQFVRTYYDEAQAEIARRSAK